MSFLVKYSAEHGCWEASVRELPVSLSLKVRADDPVTALTALVEHANQLRKSLSNDTYKFNAITAADWEQSLALAKIQPNDLMHQIRNRTYAVLSDPVQVSHLAHRAFIAEQQDDEHTDCEVFVRGYRAGVKAALTET